MRVLYVDDEPDIREVAEIALCLDPDCEVRTLGSGPDVQALLQTGEWRPDVMLLDVMMPGMDGPQTLAAARQTAVGRDLPVIFITARVLVTDRERLLSLGAIGVIPKPFDPMKLGAEVARLIAGAQ